MLLERDHRLVARDGVRLCLVQVCDPGRHPPSGRHVLLTHGLFSDRRICRGLAQFLAEQGFTCWILEWRGHGASEKPWRAFDFETIALQDVPAAWAYLSRQGVERLDCVAHSGGGIVLTMALVHAPDWQGLMGRWALLACQTSGAAEGLAAQACLRGARALSAALGRLPGWVLGLGAGDERHPMLRPWFDWNLNRHFRSSTGLDYGQAMREFRFPVLALAAEGDRWIAPPAGCRGFWEAFGGRANRFRLAGPQLGHGSLMLSRAARLDVWPLVLDWLDAPPGGP